MFEHISTCLSASPYAALRVTSAERNSVRAAHCSREAFFELSLWSQRSISEGLSADAIERGLFSGGLELRSSFATLVVSPIRAPRFPAEA